MDLKWPSGRVNITSEVVADVREEKIKKLNVVLPIVIGSRNPFSADVFIQEVDEERWNERKKRETE